jgi:hypothetical protein
VAGDPADAKDLAAARAPDPTVASAIRPQVITEGELADTELTDSQCIFLSNVAQLTADEARRLQQYVEQGGGLAIFLGDRVEAKSYNALARGEKPLLPAALGEVRTEAQFGVDPLGYRHPIAAPFRGRERAGLLTTLASNAAVGPSVGRVRVVILFLLAALPFSPPFARLSRLA